MCDAPPHPAGLWQKRAVNGIPRAAPTQGARAATQQPPSNKVLGSHTVGCSQRLTWHAGSAPIEGHRPGWNLNGASWLIKTVCPQWQGLRHTCHTRMCEWTVRRRPSIWRCISRRPKPTRSAKGYSIFLGRTDGGICPVAAIFAYMGCKAQAGVHSSHSAAIHDSNQGGTTEGRCRPHVGHRGAAPTAAPRGVWWECAAYMVYIQTPQPTICEVPWRGHWWAEPEGVVMVLLLLGRGGGRVGGGSGRVVVRARNKDWVLVGHSVLAW